MSSLLERDWKEFIDEPFPPVGPITEETVQDMMAMSHKFRGSIRMATGRVWTDKELEAYRQRIMNTPLP